MKPLSMLALNGLQAICLWGIGDAARAADITVLCANGMQMALEDLGPKFERASGHRLVLRFATGGAAAQRAADGESVDLLIAPQPGIDAVVKAGKATATNVTALARTGISVAVRKGATRPDISSAEALKRALLAAKSITYLDPKDGGASGIHFARVLDRLAVADEVKPKTIFAPRTDAVGAMVANGQAEIGVLQFQLLFAVPGIEVIGPLPGDLQSTTVFSAALLGSAKEVDASKAFVAFLRTPEAAAAIQSMGMQPASP